MAWFPAVRFPLNKRGMDNNRLQGGDAKEVEGMGREGGGES